MKNKLTKIIFITLVAVFAAGPAFAATYSLSPSSVNVKQGQSFNVTVTLDPQSAASYTSKLELKYPADLLEIKSFSFASKWLALSEEGYDSVDNINGVLMKTAGYPKGTTSPVTFGTVSFSAKKSGNGLITIGGNSAVYDVASKNTFSGSSSQVAVTAAAATPTPIATRTPATGSPGVTPLQSPAASISPTVSPSAGPIVGQPRATLLAAIGSIITLGTGSWFIALIVILAIAYGAYWLIKRKLKK